MSSALRFRLVRQVQYRVKFIKRFVDPGNCGFVWCARCNIVSNSLIGLLIQELRLRVVPLSLCPSCVTRTKTARKKWSRENLVARSTRKEKKDCSFVLLILLCCFLSKRQFYAFLLDFTAEQSHLRYVWLLLVRKCFNMSSGLVNRCEAKFSKVGLEIFMCTWVK